LNYTTVTDNTGVTPISDTIYFRGSALFGYVIMLENGTPVHSALRLVLMSAKEFLNPVLELPGHGGGFPHLPIVVLGTITALPVLSLPLKRGMGILKKSYFNAYPLSPPLRFC